MALSNHQALEVSRRISRTNETSQLSGIQFGLSLASELVADGIDRAKILAAIKIVVGKATEVHRKQDADHLALTIEALGRCGEWDEKTACLMRLGWFLDDAIEAGLIEEFRT
ncbi:hypothetical protein [Primorskyibacter marinus]|uniref:hypothetical protein n=1 Tax=Primorskyibacter marinus TaxID=1977320 RepID=UPI000E3065D9|nr:hypothetical protein [Primorskyibacter marinus]